MTTSPQTDSDLSIPILPYLFPETERPLLVILASLALAKIFDKTNTGFIATLLQKAYPFSRPGFQVDVLGAVVDQVSLPAGIHENKDFGWRHPHPPGLDGLSFLSTSAKNAGLDLWNEGDSVSQSDDVGPATLSFNLRCPADQPVTSPDSGSSSLSSCTIDLPLANTVFQNGRTSTLCAQAWSVTGQSDDSQRLNTNADANFQLTKNRELDHKTVRLSSIDVNDLSVNSGGRHFTALTPSR